MTTPRRSGFATVTALLLVGLIVVVLASVTKLAAADARRTRSQRDEAQLRQLLTAGALAAQTQLDRAPTTQPTEVALPAEIDGKLTFTLAKDADQITAVVHAERGMRKVEQTVRFERRDGKWAVASATLQP